MVLTNGGPDAQCRWLGWSVLNEFWERALKLAVHEREAGGRDNKQPVKELTDVHCVKGAEGTDEHEHVAPPGVGRGRREDVVSPDWMYLEKESS